MAINLWKLSGQQTAYNPLPTPTQMITNLTPYKEYIFIFKAKSESGARLNVSSLTNTAFDLTNFLKEYTHTFTCGSTSILYVNDINDKGDILIQDIQLIEKPLDKLTVNGLSGEVADWEQGSITAEGGTAPSSTRIRLTNETAFLSGQTYTLSVPSGYEVIAHRGTSLTSWGNTVVFTADKTRGRIAVKKTNDSPITPSEITNIKPMLNLGSTQAPYSKKTGERMWVPGKPKVKVAKKNLLPSFYQWTKYMGNPNILSANSVQVSTADRVEFVLPINNTKRYSLQSIGSNDATMSIHWRDANNTFISDINIALNGLTKREDIQPPANSVKARIIVFGVGAMTKVDNIQFEEGSVATPYEPYTEVLPPSRKGLVLDGVSNYLQLPSMMMDSVEIDCLIDGVQPISNPVLLDARTGLADGWIGNDQTLGAFGAGWSSALVNGVQVVNNWNNIPKNQRVKIKVSTSLPFTDNVNLFNRYSIERFTKGILYSVKCYLNGQVVAAYDFTSPKNIIGDKVLQSARNLIPGYSDPRWSLHPNFKVLGNDVGRLEAASSFRQDNVIKVNINNNADKNYYFDFGAPLNSYSWLFFRDNLGGFSRGSLRVGTYPKGGVVSVPANTVTIEMLISSDSVGFFDFIRPQLYELDGKEGTLYGSPVSELKAPKRVLYAKR
jgi:hypothetical protein